MTETREEILRKSKAQRKRVLTFLFSSLLALVICMGVVVSVALSLITEGIEPLDEVPIEVNTPCPSSKGEALSYIKNITSAANDNNKVFVNSSVWLSIPDDSVDFSGNDAEKSILSYMKGSIQSSLDGFYPEDKGGEFGADFTDFPAISLAENDVESFSCEAGYQNDKGERVDSDRYFCELTVSPTNYPHEKDSAVYSTFRLNEVDGIADRLKDEYASLLAVNSLDIAPVEYKVKTTSWCADDKIIDLTLSRTYRVSVAYTFIGDYASLGAQTLSFDYTVNDKFSYTWASVKFSEADISVKEGESRKLNIKATLNDYSDYEIRFESSDSDTVSIDELGYVTGLKNSAEPVTVTVYLSYLGFEYSDTCTVNVRTSVEKIKISDDNKTVSVGDTFTLTASVKPDDATVKDVFYKSSDESVATVTSDGVVTALNEGEALITAISVDGCFKDSCKLTVTGKGAK